jgi:hypothetical protein
VDYTTLWTSFIGSGAGTTFVGLLFKRKVDRELEVQKAFLQRTSRVHEKQVELLAKVYHHLWEAHAYLVLMSASVHMANEKPEEYPGKFSEAIVAARDALFGGRVLMPSALADRCEDFFKKLFEGQMQLGFARSPMIQDGLQREQFWDRAQKIANEEVPALLKTIESEARVVIHGSDLRP